MKVRTYYYRIADNISYFSSTFNEFKTGPEEYTLRHWMKRFRNEIKSRQTMSGIGSADPATTDEEHKESTIKFCRSWLSFIFNSGSDIAGGTTVHALMNLLLEDTTSIFFLPLADYLIIPQLTAILRNYSIIRNYFVNTAEMRTNTKSNIIYINKNGESTFTF